RPFDLGDDVGVQRLARTEDLTQPFGFRAEIGLDQHAPHRGWRTESVDTRTAKLVQQRGGIETVVVVDEDGRLSDPGGEKTTPCVLGPARRADRKVNVTGAQADPRHRRQVPDRIADLRVLYQFRLARGA